MREIVKNNYCLCGHSVYMHITGENCFYNIQMSAGLKSCLCQVYKADNLKYLEQLDEQNH